MTTLTTLTLACEVWLPTDQQGWTLKEASHADPSYSPASTTLAPGNDFLDRLAIRRGPIVGTDVALGDRPAGTLPMVIAIPTYDGTDITSVLILGCQSTSDNRLALEIWGAPAGDYELHHEDGLYPNMERFERISKYVHFPWASGLPGRAWESAAPQLLTEIGESLAFLRSSGATDAGLDIGLSIPVILKEELRGVAVLLAGGDTPLFRAIEIFQPTDNHLVRVESYGDAAAFLAAHDELAPAAPGVDLAGHAWSERRAIIDTSLSAPQCRRTDAAQADQLQAVIALPILLGEEVRAVLQLAI